MALLTSSSPVSREIAGPWISRDEPASCALRNAWSHHEQGEPRRVRSQRCQHLKVVAVAGDDPNVLSCSTLVSLRRDDGIDACRRRVQTTSDGCLPERAGSVADRNLNIDDVHDVEEATDVVVVPDVAGEEPFGEYGRRDHKVTRLLAKKTKASATLLVEWREPLDATGVEDDDQSAARCPRRAGAAGFRRVA